MKRFLLLLLLLPLSVRAGEIVLPKFDIPWHQQGALTTPQSDQLTKFLEDGLKAAKAAGDKELIKAYEETLEIHYDDPLNPNPLAERASALSTGMQEYHGNDIGFKRSKIIDCKTEDWAVRSEFKPVSKTVVAYARTKKINNIIDDIATCEESSVLLLCESGDCGVVLPEGEYGYFPTMTNKASIDGRIWIWKGELPWWISKQMWSALKNRSQVSWELVHWPYDSLVTGSQETNGNTTAKNLVYSESVKPQ